MIELTLTLIVVVLFVAAALYYDKLPAWLNVVVDEWARLWLNRHGRVVLDAQAYHQVSEQLQAFEARLRKLGGGSRSKTAEPTKQARRVIERAHQGLDAKASEQGVDSG